MRALALALALGGTKLAPYAVKADPVSKDVKVLSIARDAGEAPDYAVYKADRSDGGTVYYGLKIELLDAGTRIETLKDGGQLVVALEPVRAEKVTFLDGSPCRRRPAKSTPGTCNLSLPDGGERDFGADNVMQAGQWVDRGGCIETPCAVFFGEAP